MTLAPWPVLGWFQAAVCDLCDKLYLLVLLKISFARFSPLLTPTKFALWRMFFFKDETSANQALLVPLWQSGMLMGWLFGSLDCHCRVMELFFLQNQNHRIKEVGKTPLRFMDFSLWPNTTVSPRSWHWVPSPPGIVIPPPTRQIIPMLTTLSMKKFLLISYLFPLQMPVYQQRRCVEKWKMRTPQALRKHH